MQAFEEALLHFLEVLTVRRVAGIQAGCAKKSEEFYIQARRGRVFKAVTVGVA